MNFDLKNTVIGFSILLLFLSPQIEAQPVIQSFQERITNSLLTGKFASVLNNLNSLEPLKQLYTVASVDSTKLELYTGTYKIQSDFKVVVTKKEDRLICGINNSQKYPLYAESVNTFSFKSVNARIEFVDDGNAKFESIKLYYSNRMFEGKRVEGTGQQQVEDQITKEIKTPKEEDYIELSSGILSKYTGTYFNSNGERYYVFYRDLQLRVQAAGESSRKVFAKTERRFSFESIQAEIEFSDNGTGASQSFTLYQNGEEVTATRKKNQQPNTQAQAPDNYSLSQFEGTFKIRPGFYITITKVGSQLTTQISGQEENPADRLGKSTYHIKSLDAKIEFIPDGNGNINKLKIYQSDRTVIAVRLDE